MGILNKLFGSSETAAKEILIDENLIKKHWKEYLNTIPKKEMIIEHLHQSNFKAQIPELKKLLNLELTDIKDEEKEDLELLSDLGKIEHSKKIMRIHRLEQCLGYAETKHEYLHGLLQHLHSALKAQMFLLEPHSLDAEKTISKLKAQLNLEQEIIKKIQNINTFHNLFTALAKGEHIVKTMAAREKRLLSKMQNGVSKIFSNEITEGAIYNWAIGVNNAIEDKVHEMVSRNLLEQHYYMDFEFVNKKAFTELAREIVYGQGHKKVSEQMINVFVHLFREWYNSREN